MLKIRAALGAALFAFGFARSALAQGTDEFGAYGGLERTGQKESPQHAAFELRFGPYRPNVDSEFAGATPFEDTFGNCPRIGTRCRATETLVCLLMQIHQLSDHLISRLDRIAG